MCTLVVTRRKENAEESATLVDHQRMPLREEVCPRCCRETAAGLAGDGATVVLGCRNLQKAEEVASQIRKRHIKARVIVCKEALDLARPESIR